MSKLEFEKRGAVAILRLNRPEARNAFDPETYWLLSDAWLRVRDDAEIRVAIVTGTGDVFCSGADLRRSIPLLSGARQPEDEFDRKTLADPDVRGRAILRTLDVGKPVIAAINGHAIAGGMEMVEGTDLRIAARTARLGLQEVRWGLFPAGGSTVRLPRQMPYVRAMELLLTGALIDAEEALALGFLNKVVEPTEVLDAALAMAALIASNGPLAVRAIRRSVRACQALPEREGLRIELEHSAPVFASEDAREGPRAFLEKRKPSFNGR